MFPSLFSYFGLDVNHPVDYSSPPLRLVLFFSLALLHRRPSSLLLEQRGLLDDHLRPLPALFSVALMTLCEHLLGASSCLPGAIPVMWALQNLGTD